MAAGGAGYIGSHTVAELLQRVWEVVVVDSLKNGGDNIQIKIDFR